MPPKQNEERRNKVRFIEIGNCESKKQFDNGKNDNDQKIYVFMARMSDNDKCPSSDFGDSSKFTNCLFFKDDNLATKPKSRNVG